MTKPLALAASLLAAACLLPAAPARGEVVVQAIDRGVPTDGTLTMDGFRGFTVRLVSDEGPITRVELQPLDDGGVRGSLAHRWTDPQGNGDYTQRSPGFLPFDNTTPSVFNFDSHMLGDPSHFQVFQPPSEGAMFGLFERTGIPSTPSVQYGVSTPQTTFDPFLANTSSFIGGVYEVLPAFQSDVLDLAYVVTDSRFLIGAEVDTTSGTSVLIADFLIPEPGMAATAVVGSLMFLCRRRRGGRRATARIEQLEPRRMLSVSAAVARGR